MNKSRTVQFIVLMFFVIGTTLAAAQTVSMQYENGFLSASIQSVTLKEIFEELKKQTGMNYEIEKEIQEQKVTISFKEKELTQAIKDILNTIGNPSYMISYKNVIGAIGQSPKYAVSGITIRKRGSSDTTAQTAKRDLQPGEMEVGLVTDDPKWNAEFKNLKKYNIRAKDADLNELLEKLSNIVGVKILAVKIDKKIDFEGEDDFFILMRHFFDKIRPKIYDIKTHDTEVDRKGNIIKPGYYEVTRLSDEEIQKRREKAIMANTEAEKLIKQGRYREAIDAFGKGYDPDYITPHINLGEIYLLYKDYSTAVRLFSSAVEIDENNAEGYSGLIEAYEKLGQMDNALENMKKYVLLEKDAKKVEQIKKKIEKLEDKALKEYYSLIKNGDEFKQKRNLLKAEEAYKKAIEIKPDLFNAYERLALFYEEGEAYSNAEDMYKKTIERDKKNYEFYLRLATVDAMNGKKKEAIDLMKEAIKLCPVEETIFRIKEAIKVLEEGGEK